MKFIVKILVFMFFLLITSCEDNLNPFKETEDLFILNCLLKHDRGFQSVALSKSYFSENFDPYSKIGDHTVKDAFIRIYYEDSVKFFLDTLIQKNDKIFTLYYTNDFYTKPDTEYEIEAILSNGRKLTSKTRTPKEVRFSVNSDNIIPPANKNSVSVRWESDNPLLYTAARFTFIYFKIENNKNVRFEKEVPRAYVQENGTYTAFYPEPSYANSITVQMNAFDKALMEISDGDPNKGNYTILAFILEILVYDRNLTSYYASKKELGDGFSITVNESDYSNINGGRGIFGSFIKQRFAIKFSHDYIRSFGYIPGLTEVKNE